MITDELKKLVKDEAVKLREFATSTEIRKLNLRVLSGNDPFRCIYGQMTGYCRSDRAVALLKSCALPVAFSHGSFWHDTQKSGGAFPEFFSAVEIYITQYGSKKKSLIAYLKGETEVLDI